MKKWKSKVTINEYTKLNYSVNGNKIVFSPNKINSLLNYMCSTPSCSGCSDKKWTDPSWIRLLCSLYPFHVISIPFKFNLLIHDWPLNSPPLFTQQHPSTFTQSFDYLSNSLASSSFICSTVFHGLTLCTELILNNHNRPVCALCSLCLDCVVDFAADDKLLNSSESKRMADPPRFFAH